MTPDEALANADQFAKWRKELQEEQPTTSETIAAEVRRLREELAKYRDLYASRVDAWAKALDEANTMRAENEELSRGGIHWWHAMRKVAKVLGVGKLTDCEAKAAELRSLVDRLPKTADGVPVVPGMEVYDKFCGHALTVSGFDTRPNGTLACLYSRGGGFDAICSGYYYTREAAAAAKEAK